MIHRLISHLRGNAVAYVALFVALGGTSYAAVSLPRNSVGTRQLRNGSVTPRKLSGKEFGGRILAVTELEEDGTVLKSNPKTVTTSDWTPSSGGFVNYPFKIARDCFPVASPTQPLLPLTDAVPQVSAAMASFSSVQIAESGPTQLTLMIICQH